MRAKARLSFEEAAATAIAVPLRYAQSGLGMAQAALAGARRFETLRHYPAHDVIDRRAGTQFYYHAHGSSRRPAAEHGHVHLFVREVADDPDAFFHLAGLSLDAQGRPLRWFTTNRWVTDERWVGAEHAIATLAGFVVRARGRLAPVADWLTALVSLYRPRLEQLLRRRDAVLRRRVVGGAWEALLEDRRLDVVTETRISLQEDIRAMLARGRAPSP